MTMQQALERSRLLPALLLVIVTLLCTVPGFFTISVVDRDEARFAQASRQMLESGDYITPRLGEGTRFKKPVGIYWLQTAVVKLTGQDATAPIWAYRLPSLFAILGAVLLLWRIGARLFGEKAGLIAALLLAVAPLVGVEARLAKTDAVQLFIVLMGQYALMRLYLTPPQERRSFSMALLFWVAMGLGALVKGPVVPLLGILTVGALVVWDRKVDWLRDLRPVIGIPLFLLIVLPWFIAIAVHAGPDFFQESFGKDMLGKVAAGQESHGAPPGLHFLTAFLTYWPGMFLVIAAAPFAWRHRNEPAIRFCIAWLVPFWLVFEMIVTKLPHYTLPAMPAAFLLVGAAFAGGGMAERAGGWRRVLLTVPPVIGLVLAVALPIAFVRFQGQVPPLLALVLCGLSAAAGVATLWRLYRDRFSATLQMLLMQAILVEMAFFGALLPNVDKLRVAPHLATAIADLHLCPRPEIMVAGMSEASLLFALGSDLRFGDGVEAADFLQEQGCRVLVLEARQKRSFEARLAELGAGIPPVLDRVEGMNLGSGKPVSLDILARPQP